MKNIMAVLSLALVLVAHATPPQSTPTNKPRLTKEWIKKDETTWETKVFTLSVEWELQAVRLSGVMYLRQSIDCPEGSAMKRRQVIAQAKNALTSALVECDGTTGFALVGWFLSDEFLKSLPDEVRTWYNQSPSPTIVLPSKPRSPEPGTSI